MKYYLAVLFAALTLEAAANVTSSDGVSADHVDTKPVRPELVHPAVEPKVIMVQANATPTAKTKTITTKTNPTKPTSPRHANAKTQLRKAHHRHTAPKSSKAKA